MKKSPRKKLVAKLDKTFSEYIRARDGKCVQCGATERLTCGHLITRSKYSVRWDSTNAFGQCSKCNLLHEYQPERFTSWFIEKYGKEKYLDLVFRSNQIVRYNNDELLFLTETYQELRDKISWGAE